MNILFVHKPAAFSRSVDWMLFLALIPILGAGLVTMYSFAPTGACQPSSALEPSESETAHTPCVDAVGGPFFRKQLIWIACSFLIFFAGSFVDWRFLRRGGVLFGLFLAGAGMLFLLFATGKVIKGAQSWFDLGFFNLQPVELVKLVLILVLAKYFSRRHIEIKHIRHIIVSSTYASILFVLVLLQPDFGGAIVIGLLWLGMVLLSGISKKHLLSVILIAALSGLFLWTYVFKEYQKQRLVTFIHPLTDIRGSGYNAYQSTIAVGSGEWFGKGVGYGTQSRLQFLPEYETDFIFAAFAEEWGFVGVLVLCALYALLIWRILLTAMHGQSNFEILYGLGFAIFIMSQFLIHVGMNLGLLPVTGISLPFMSYGGTHMVTLFLGLGILMGMRRYSRAVHKEAFQNEFVGVHLTARDILQESPQSSSQV
jgi:rod shape determining protein RodA